MNTRFPVDTSTVKSRCNAQLSNLIASHKESIQLRSARESLSLYYSYLSSPINLVIYCQKRPGDNKILL